MKCFKRFLVFFFVIWFTAFTQIINCVRAADSKCRIIGWQDLSNNDAVLGVSIEQYNRQDKINFYTDISKYVEGNTSVNTFATANPGENIWVKIHLKDGYRFANTDGHIICLRGIQSDYSQYGNDGEPGNENMVTVPADNSNTDFYISFTTVEDSSVINNVNLIAKQPKCGLHVEHVDLPAPDITCPSDAKYTVSGGISGDIQWTPQGTEDDFYEFTVHGGEKYEFNAYVYPKDGYKFNMGFGLYGQYNDGKNIYPCLVADCWEFLDHVSQRAREVRVSGELIGEHIPMEPKDSIVEPTCTGNGSRDSIVNCEACGDELSRSTKILAATGHDWGEWAVTKKPTETEKGEKTRICRNDSSHIETEEIPMLDPKDNTGSKYYKVNFDNKGIGTTPQTQMVKEGETASVPELCYAVGYSFGGWYIDEDCTNPFDFDTPISSDITLYARWSPIGAGFIQTGDNSNLMFHSQMMLLSLVGIVIIHYKRSKRKVS